MLRFGVTVLLLSGSLALAQDGGVTLHAGPKSERVTIDSLLAEMDAPGALEGTGLEEAMEHKRLVLRFLREIVHIPAVDEALPRDSVARLTVVQPDLGMKIDEAISKGLRARITALKPFLAEPFRVEGSELVDCWMRLEVEDRMNGPALVSKLVTDLEANATQMLALATQVEGKEVKVLPEAAPAGVRYLPLAIARLGKLGVSAKERSSLDKRAQALKARYSGK